jgi:hypothetical protein
MHFGTMCTKQDHAVTGVRYDMRSMYEGLSQLSDMRKAREKLSRLETVLMIIVMADVNMQLVHKLEFFELFFNSLVAFVKKNRLSCCDFT